MQHEKFYNFDHGLKFRYTWYKIHKLKIYKLIIDINKFSVWYIFGS